MGSISETFDRSSIMLNAVTTAETKVQTFPSPRITKEHDLVLKTLRLLIADLCQQFKGGHPG